MRWIGASWRRELVEEINELASGLAFSHSVIVWANNRIGTVQQSGE